MLSELFKDHYILHERQMSSRRKRSVIDLVTRVFSRVHNTWVEGKLAVILLINVKGAFDHVSRSYLPRTMEDIETDADLMRWTESFMADRKVGLVMEGQQFEETDVDIDVPK